MVLSMQINDTTRNSLVGSAIEAGRFWVTYDETNWDDGSPNRTSNSSSYINYTFDPTCTPVKYIVSSSQKWKAGVLNDGCYVDTNSSNYTLTIKGDLVNSVTSPVGDIVYDPNNVTITGNITSDCGDDTIGDANVTFKVAHEASTYYATPNPANENALFVSSDWV